MNHLKRSGRACSHRRYLLTCEQYDDLLEAAHHRCQICGRRAEETGHGYLVVDHDGMIGTWAVRGILCSSCNNRIEYDNVPDADAAAAYLAGSWYLRVLAETGVSLDLPEPDIGARVREHGRSWTRTANGWVTPAKNAPSGAASWRELIRRYGPHNLVRVDR